MSTIPHTHICGFVPDHILVKIAARSPEARDHALSTIEQGVEATARLVTDPALDAVTGRYFDVLREAKADPQAYDAAARSALRAATERMVGIGV